MRAMACAPEHGRDGTRQAVYLTRRRGDAEKAEIRGFAPRGPTRRSTPISGTRGQTGLPANFRQKAPVIHGSLVRPRRGQWAVERVADRSGERRGGKKERVK